MTESGKSHGETEAPKNSDEEDIIAGSEGCLKVHMERRDSGWLQITPNLTKGWGKGGKDITGSLCCMGADKKE